MTPIRNRTLSRRRVQRESWAVSCNCDREVASGKPLPKLFQCRWRDEKVRLSGRPVQERGGYHFVVLVPFNVVRGVNPECDVRKLVFCEVAGCSDIAQPNQV